MPGGLTVGQQVTVDVSGYVAAIQEITGPEGSGQQDRR